MSNLCVYAKGSLDSLCGAAALYNHFKGIKIIAQEGGRISNLKPHDYPTNEEVFFIGVIPSSADAHNLVNLGNTLHVISHLDSTAAILDENTRDLSTETFKEKVKLVTRARDVFGNDGQRVRDFSAGYITFANYTNSLPVCMEHVSDYTLGTNVFFPSAAIAEALKTVQQEPEIIFNMISQPNALEFLRKTGDIILQSKHRQATDIINNCLVDLHVVNEKADFRLGVINLPESLATIVLGRVLQSDSYPMVIGYTIEKENYLINLRSAPGGYDVGKIAKELGGGGSKHTAGFRVPHAHRVDSPTSLITGVLRRSYVPYELTPTV